MPKGDSSEFKKVPKTGGVGNVPTVPGLKKTDVSKQVPRVKMSDDPKRR